MAFVSPSRTAQRGCGGARLHDQWGPIEQVAMDRIIGGSTSGESRTAGRQQDRKDATDRSSQKPARVMPEMNLFMGDLEDGCNVPELNRSCITAVVFVCSDRVPRQYYSSIPGKLAEAEIDQLILSSSHSSEFDIRPVMGVAQDFIDCVLKEKMGGVLVCCDVAGNRSAAVCAAYIAEELQMPLTEAIEEVRKGKGNVLRNRHLVKQLVQHCFAEGYPLL